MATKSTNTNVDPIADYRAKAAALRAQSAPAKAPSTFAVTVGRNLAASRNFFSIVKDVYDVERAPFVS
jgi:hypothetical protein